MSSASPATAVTGGASVPGEQQTDLFVYGLGRSGTAALRRAREAGIGVAFYDKRAAGSDVDEALALGAERVTDVAALDVTRYRTCVAAPGVRIDHPDLQRLRRLGVIVTGEVEWTWARVPGRYVGVTGTAGKGSTTLWLTEVLTAAGVEALAGGNNDPALAAVAKAGATHVVELSSFQLERTQSFRPDVAVVLNLGEDHIDRHGSAAAYQAAKRRLLANLAPDDTLVYNHDDEVVRAWARAATARRVSYSVRDAACDLYLDDATGTLSLHGESVANRDELSVTGAHQHANALAVIGAAHALGLEPEQVRAGLTSFTGLKSRYEVIGTASGVTFVDDSIATRPLAVAAALRSTPRPCVWLAGGVAKGADVTDLKRVVADHVDMLVTYGAAGPDFARSFSGLTEVKECRQEGGRDALRCAVTEAITFLRGHHGGRGVVLLSPLAASFDQFDDYAHRARVFREVVAEAAASHVAGAGA